MVVACMGQREYAEDRGQRKAEQSSVVCAVGQYTCQSIRLHELRGGRGVAGGSDPAAEAEGG